MKEAKCPACRKRFERNVAAEICTRCGADLSLLQKTYRHAQHLAFSALANPAISEEKRQIVLRQAQEVCYAPELGPLIKTQYEPAK